MNSAGFYVLWLGSFLRQGEGCIQQWEREKGEKLFVWTPAKLHPKFPG